MSSEQPFDGGDNPTPPVAPDPGSASDSAETAAATPQARRRQAYPLVPEDMARIDQFWLDARLAAQASGVVYLAHEQEVTASEGETPVLLVLLSQGAAADAAARDRFSGLVNKLHLDAVIARGGKGQDAGKLAKKFRSTEGNPPSSDGAASAPWVALVQGQGFDADAISANLLEEVQLSMLAQQGAPSGPDYEHYWINRVQPGLARMWPLPWPGRTDRAGWLSIFIAWLLTLLFAALAVLIAILVFRNLPPESPPPPSEQSSSPQEGSPSPQSGSPSPQSGSPSASGSASPSESPSSGEPTPSGSEAGSPSPRSKL